MRKKLKKDLRIFLAGGIPTAVFMSFLVPLLMNDWFKAYHFFLVILVGVPTFIALVLFQEKKLGSVALSILGVLGYILAFYNLLGN